MDTSPKPRPHLNASPAKAPAPPLTKRHTATISQRIAGVMLILNALLVVSEFLFYTPSPGEPEVMSTGTRCVSIILDLLIGLSLLKGSRSLTPFAVLRSVLGAGLYFAKASFLVAALQLLFFVPLIALVVGKPRVLRVLLAICGFALYAFLGALGTVAQVVGYNPIIAGVGHLSGQFSPLPQSEVIGVAAPYRLRMPNRDWYLRSDQLAKKDNPQVDRWLIKPDVDAHVIVVTEELGAGVSADDYAAAIEKASLQKEPGMKVLDRTTLPSGCRLIHARARTHDLELEYLYGVYVVGIRGFAVTGWSLQSKFGAVEPALRAILGSFQVIDPPPPADAPGR
jgi:hypothetical protein